MASIKLSSVGIDFPIYNANGRSLKNQLVNVATGGRLRADGRGRAVVKALDNINLTFKNGDRVGLIGHNGAGKSSLLRLLSGVYYPASGTAEIYGSIGSLIDISLGINHEATGRENIYLRASLLGLKRLEIDKVMDEIIDFTELGNFIEMPLRTYSSGMHLRLAFAVSTIIRPEIRLMDEWLSVGDEGFKKKAETRMAELIKSTHILVVASHSKELILKTCNRVIWLEHGRILMDGDSDSVVNAYFTV
jgi:lipopolysaccharide transport system ATP-binding protein